MTDTLKKIRNAFDGLEKRIFVSEADFQHALAMKLERYFNGRVRLEHPIKRPERVQTTKGEYIYADIVIQGDNKKYVIELKYKTQAIKGVPYVEDEGVLACKLLKNQSAHDFGTYDFWADINRGEQLVKQNGYGGGVCIFLTNDSNYTKPHPDTIFSNFSIEGGTHGQGDKKWKATGRCPKQRIAEIQKTRPDLNIENSYDFKWQDFLTVSDALGDKFQYLYIEIPPKAKD